MSALGGFVCDALELRGDGGEPLLLLLRDRFETLGLDPEARCGLRQQLLLPLTERGDLRAQLLICALEVGGPFAEARADARLDLRERLAQLGVRLALALVDGDAAFLGHAALLFDEARE